VLLALPFRYRHKINYARAAMLGRSRDVLQACSLRLRPLIVSRGPGSSLPGVAGHRGLLRMGMNRTQLQRCVRPSPDQPPRCSCSAPPPALEFGPSKPKACATCCCPWSLACHWMCPCPPTSTAVAVATGRWMSVVDVNSGSWPADQLRSFWSVKRTLTSFGVRLLCPGADRVFYRRQAPGQGPAGSVGR
jgi:hypothetical protein